MRKACMYAVLAMLAAIALPVAAQAATITGVKAAIVWVEILAPARLAQRPVPHRRSRAVVRKFEHDAVARTAVGAIDVRVCEAAVGGIEQLAPALLAHRQVR